MTRRLRLAGVLAPGWALMVIPAPLAALELVIPVDCKVGQDCVIQQYMDHDPAPEARDYTCGTATYDGHDGTDFRLRTTREAEQGVAVLAAAAGTVTAERDGMADVLRRTPEELSQISDRECGNGVVIDHGGGWETQYCHMKRGSLAVEAGETVEAAQKLGEIGYSGAAAFAHLHLTVRHDGEPVDPFLGPDADAGSCGAGAEPLWTSTALADLDYAPGRILDVGFAPGPIEMQALETGAVQDSTPDRHSPAIVAWGWAINLEEGDEIMVVLGGPDGGELARNSVTLDRSKAQYMLFAGTRPPAAGWPAGRYTASFTVSRTDAPAISEERELMLE